MKKRKAIVSILMAAMVLGMQGNPTSVKAAGEPTYIYSGEDAADYAKRFYKDYNNNYNAFKNDCTNFASQAVFVGNQLTGQTGFGRPEKGGNIEETASDWYYISGVRKTWPVKTYACSTSWIRCSGKKIFKTYWKKCKVGKYSLKKVRKKAKKGDVIQITKEDGGLKHTIIVVNVSGGEVYCASHTKDYKNDSLEKIDERATESWGDCEYTLYHFAK